MLANTHSPLQLILVDAKPSVRKQILRELQIMNDCSSPYIVGYYGCFPVDVHVGIVMEFMDLGYVKESDDINVSPTPCRLSYRSPMLT
jgi:serine/threonine protein kinase